MRRALRIGTLTLLAVGGAALLAAHTLVPERIDRSVNRTAPGPYQASARAEALLRGSRVVDLHADPLLWSRDLLERHDYGQVDLPRLVDGNVALQVFGVVTKSPAGQNFDRNAADARDQLTPLVVAQAWPVRTWGSLYERARYQAERLHDAASRSAGALEVVRSRGDLERFFAARAQAPGRVAGLLAIEGLHALEGELDHVDALFEAGVRMMGLAHFFDNAVSGSSAGEVQYGLTDFGHRVLARMEALGIALDLAHASPAAIRDALAAATRPVVVSHTGVQATCPGPRNLSDDEILAIAENGGVIGVAYFEGAVCDPTAAGIARAMRHVRDLVGARHVALGSDFDGSIEAPFDATGLPQLVDALLETGFSDDEIRGALGGNALRVLARTLPR